MHHILKHGDKAFPYFYYDKKKYVLYRIKAILYIKCKYIQVDLKRILAKDKAMKALGRKQFMTWVVGQRLSKYINIFMIIKDMYLWVYQILIIIAL